MDKPTVVIDNGSETYRAGFAGESSPMTFPSIVGTPRHKGVGDLQDDDFFFGDQAKSRRGDLRIKYPVEWGVVTNWDDMEKLWNHTFCNDLRIDPTEQPIFLTETPMNPKVNREKTTQIMFETFNFPAVFLENQAVCALYANGLTTGIVLDSGNRVSHVVPVYEECALPYATPKVLLSGLDVTDYLMKLLTERGFSFTTLAEREIAREIKERFCYVALDFEQEMRCMSTPPERYTLPNGEVISLDKERFRCSESLFTPSLIGHECRGIHESLYYSIMKCDKDTTTSDLFDNIVLAGGTSLLPGFANRLQKELDILAPIGMKSRVLAIPDRRFCSWSGGSMWASRSTFLDACVTIDEYDEFGPAIVHRKCF